MEAFHHVDEAATERTELRALVPSRTGGTFQEKTPGTWRVSVLKVLVLLRLRDVGDLREGHRLQAGARVVLVRP